MTLSLSPCFRPSVCPSPFFPFSVIEVFLMEVSRVFQRSFNGVSRVFQELFKKVSRKIEGCFKEVFSGFQEYLKEV